MQVFRLELNVKRRAHTLTNGENGGETPGRRDHEPKAQSTCKRPVQGAVNRAVCQRQSVHVLEQVTKTLNKHAENYCCLKAAIPLSYRIKRKL